jgi:hypothetical protein
MTHCWCDTCHWADGLLRSFVGLITGLAVVVGRETISELEFGHEEHDGQPEEPTQERRPPVRGGPTGEPEFRYAVGTLVALALVGSVLATLLATRSAYGLPSPRWRRSGSSPQGWAWRDTHPKRRRRAKTSFACALRLASKHAEPCSEATHAAW